jgi:hypothetical protein
MLHWNIVLRTAGVKGEVLQYSNKPLGVQSVDKSVDKFNFIKL